MGTITQYINRVYGDFCNYLNEDPQLCDLKTMNFDLEEFPDYTDINIQQYYLLRYAYAYEFEYSTMYEDLFKLYMNKNQDISVLSIGCGTGLDARGLYDKYMLGTRYDCVYNGVDIVDWNYKYNHIGVFYHNEDVTRWLERQANLDINILFFPKSISELNDSQLRYMARRISEINNSDDLYIMISLRANEYTIQEDYRKSEVLYNEFNRFGYTYVDGNIPYQHRYFTQPKKGIVCFNGRNSYPDEAINLCMELNEYCATYKQYNENCDECDIERLTRKPILTVGTIKYQIIHLKKE